MTAAERMVERECVGCGATFRKEDYEVKRGNGLYCTLACKNTYARLNSILDRKAALLRAGAVREIEPIPAGDTVLCADCGIGFEAGARGRPAARCALCQRAREQAAAKAKRRAAR